MSGWDRALDVHVSARGPFAVGSVVWRDATGQLVCTIVAKATYELGPGEAQPLDNGLPLQEDDGHWDDDDAKSVHVPSDLAPFKNAAEVVLVGSAFAPSERPARSVTARLVVGSVDKAVEAFPARYFGNDGLVHEAPAMVRFPLRYEHAAGGKHTQNPAGIEVGLRDARGRHAIPQVLPLFQKLGGPGDYLPPIGFGPIASTWQQRVEGVGPHEQAWIKRPQASPLPQNFPAKYFQAAPPDQWLDRPLAANERIVLEGLHGKNARLVMNLAGLEPRAILGTSARSEGAVRLQADLLFMDTDQGLATLTYRAQIPIREGQRRLRAIVVGATMGAELSPERVAELAEEAEEELSDEEKIEVTQAPHMESVLTTSAGALPWSMQRPALPFAGGRAPSRTSTPSAASSPPRVSVLGSTGLPFGRAGAAPKASGSVPPPPPEPNRNFLSGQTMEIDPSQIEALLPPRPRPSSPPGPGSTPPPPLGGAAASALSSSPSVGVLAPPAANVPAPPIMPAMVPPASPISLAGPMTAVQPPPPMTAPPPIAPIAIPAPPVSSPAMPAMVAPAPISLSGLAPAMAPTIGQASQGQGPGGFSVLSSTPRGTTGGLGSPRSEEARPGSSSLDAIPAPSPSTPRDDGPPKPGRVSSSSFDAMFGASKAATKPSPGRAVSFDDAFGGVRAASDAAAQKEATKDPVAAAREARAEAAPRRHSVVDLLSFEARIAPRLRGIKRFASAFGAPKGRSLLDEAKPGAGSEDQKRADVLRLLSCGRASDGQEIRLVLTDLLEDLSDFDPPLVLVGGELRPVFDEVESLRAAVAVAQPVAGGDKRLLSTIAIAQEALNAPFTPRPDAALGFTRQIEQAASSLSLPPRYVATEVERVMLEGRKFKKRVLLGSPRVRADLTLTKGGETWAVYLPDAAANSLPLLPAFPVMAICEVRPREDQAEPQAEALLALALGRVLHARPESG